MNLKIYWFVLLSILVLGFILRFWHYTDRFGLAYDQAHDAIVAREALRQGKIPLVGPFSSAGPFQTSGTWYWLLMLPTAVYKNSILSPWIFLTVLCGFFVLGMGILGSKIESNFFGLLLAGLTAVSTAQIAQSVNLTNQTPIPLFAFLALVYAVSYTKKKTLVSSFGMGFFAGLAASIHLQGMALGIVVIWALLLGRVTIWTFIFALIGAILPMLPIVLWDTSNDFINIKNMLYYYRYDQFNISLEVLGRRWLTYLTEFWPREWAYINGGVSQIAMGIAIGAVVLFVFQVGKKKVSKAWFLIFLTFGSMVVLVRYTHVPIFASFIAFTHPFVLLITAWALYQVYTFKRIIGSIVIALVFVFTMMKTGKEVFQDNTNITAKKSTGIRTELTSIYPGEKFTIYDWKYDDPGRSVPLVLYMDEKNLLSNIGRPIGFTRRGIQDRISAPIISTSSGTIADLSGFTSIQLIEAGWIPINPYFIYKSTEEWRK